ncbi:mutS, partial [Symbiodinium pilosum]
MERALSSLSLGRGGPRDLAAIRDGLGQAGHLQALLLGRAEDAPPAGLAEAAEALGPQEALVDRLSRALTPELPALARDGGFVAPGYAPQLDELKQLRDESRRLIAGLQAKYVEATGIASLKVKHNNVLGYFVEVSNANAGKMPEDGAFRHRQTLASAVRYTTVELGELEQKILQAADRALALELEIFNRLVEEVLACAGAVAAAAQALAELDVAAGLAQLAVEARWTRPQVEDSEAFRIEAGRHPVVEAALAAEAGARFVANDCDLSPTRRLWLVTGPNMIGSFVPAARAVIGTVDRLFSRVGAADDLARGRSTFMVEMVEAAAILNQATPRSL